MNSTANGRPVVPRTGYIVEFNSLWYNALRFAADLLADDQDFAAGLQGIYEKTAPSFVETFLNEYGYLLDFVDILQQELIRAGILPVDYDFEAYKELVPMQAGDVPITYADTSALEKDFGFKPDTSLRDGLRRFAQWYKEFYLK